MAKELPYFKFEPAEWLAGRISLEPYNIQGAYISICSLYWQKLSEITERDAKLRIGSELLKQLIDKEFISVDGEFITIKWLERQLDERQAVSEKRRLAGAKGGKANATKFKANAKQKVAEEKRREKKIDIPTFEEFLEHALSKKANLCTEALTLKYESWVENGWKNGNDKPIKNWKSSLNNTIPYLPTNSTSGTNDYATHVLKQLKQNDREQ